MAKTATLLDSFLAPLVRLALKHPDVEGEVLWADAGGWQAQDDDADLLDAEEIAFYAEGLLLDGFCLHYQILAEITAPKEPVQVRLFFWQATGTPPPVPDLGPDLGPDLVPDPAPETGLCLTGSGTWTG